MRDVRYLQMGESEKRNIRESYDTLGGRLYDLRYKSEQESKYAKILKCVKLTSHDTVLDIGCGTGMFLLRLEVQSVGSDISPALVSRAHSRLKRKLKKSLVLSDAEILPFRSNIFDTVFAVTFIQNVADPEKSLVEMSRVSRESATIVVTALKRAFTVEKIKEILVKSNLQLNCIIRDDSLKDWIALTNSRVK